MRITAILAALLLLVAAGWALDHVWQQRTALSLRVTQAEQQTAAAKATADQQAVVLQAQATQLAGIASLDKAMRELGQKFTHQAAAQAAEFAELKANDKAVADYLRGAVPSALGRLYERKATTDPLAYGSSSTGGMPAGPVRATSPTGAAGQ